MKDQTDSDVENGSVPPTLPNLLTLADQQGDDDEKTIDGLPSLPLRRCTSS